jgi:hypothetical protein
MSILKSRSRFDGFCRRQEDMSSAIFRQLCMLVASRGDRSKLESAICTCP